MAPTKIVDLLVRDIRYPTSLKSDGSDASHPHPDYSMVYVQLVTDDPNMSGFGLTFTIGRGNEVVLKAVDSLRFLAMDRDIKMIQGKIYKIVLQFSK